MTVTTALKEINTSEWPWTSASLQRSSTPQSWLRVACCQDSCGLKRAGHWSRRTTTFLILSKKSLQNGLTGKILTRRKSQRQTLNMTWELQTWLISLIKLTANCWQRKNLWKWTHRSVSIWRSRDSSKILKLEMMKHFQLPKNPIA